MSHLIPALAPLTRYSYLDFARYSWGANMINQFTHVNGIPYVENQDVLQYFGLSGVNEWAFIGK